jgi:GntR family transcriptional regulator of vanillate catabolism
MQRRYGACMSTKQSERLPQALRAKLRLRELILEGGLRGGERLAELPLASQLGVSRTPLRLALSQLESEGVLEAIPGGGFAVCTFTQQQVADAIDLRGVLEGMAARLAAERLGDSAELEAMQGCVAQLDALVRPDRPAIEAFERYVKLNARFHLLLAKLAKSRALEAAIAHVEALPFASPRSHTASSTWPRRSTVRSSRRSRRARGRAQRAWPASTPAWRAGTSTSHSGASAPSSSCPGPG